MCAPCAINLWAHSVSFVKQLLLDIAPPPLPTLANFVPGRNAELLQTLENIPTGRKRSVSFIYGATRDAGRVTCCRGWLEHMHASPDECGLFRLR